MPAARLIALAPAPAQQLQLLRSASSAGGNRTSSGHGGIQNGHKGPSSSRAMSTALPRWCRCSSPTAPAAATLFHCRARRPAAVATTPSGSRRARLHQASTTSAARFGTATLPKHTAFPRHGKAVAPLQVPGEKALDENASAEDSQALQASRAVTVAADEETATAESQEKRPAKKNSKRGKGGAEAKAKESDVAVTTSTESTTATPSTAPTETNDTDTLEPPPLLVEAEKDLGREGEGEGEDKANYEPSAGVAAEAAAATATAATAAEAESVPIGIASDAAPVIELGPPTATIGAILEPDEKQEKQQQGEDSPNGGGLQLPPLRQPLSQKPPPPHLAPPLYVHHFDSYSLVRQLEAGGYSQAQAITAMKAVRLLLAQNLDVAQSSLVSKSDVENEAYLFKAACAELSIEVRNNRRRDDEQMRQQRTLLQHEVDIAAQSVNQELVTLTDVVQGLFNDRKMAVREEQKTVESAIQQLSYKITIMLNSEMRSEIEGLRWVLIRRSVLGIIFMAILTLGTLRYASYLSHEKQKEVERAAREAREAEVQRFADTKVDMSAPPDAAEILAAN